MAEQVKLSELFQKGMEGQRKVESGEISSGSEELKSCVSEAISRLEVATRMVNTLSLFSSNEAIEEIATTDLKYLLLPALMGDLTLQVMEGERTETIRRAKVYCVDYLQRCKAYAITSEEPPSLSPPASGASPQPPAPTNSSSSAARVDLERLATERAARIARLREQKQMEKRLQELTKRLEKDGEQSVDEELVREHTLTLLRTWVFRCQAHVRAIDQELEILEGMERMRRSGARHAAADPPPPPRQPMKPILITSEMLRGQVFGAGYPSLPTMSLEEFYEKTYRQQVEQREREEKEAREKPPKSKVEEEEEKEEEEEGEDSEESLRKARDWDDFKDDHRRGWGNTKNMG